MQELLSNIYSENLSIKCMLGFEKQSRELSASQQR